MKMFVSAVLILFVSVSVLSAKDLKTYKATYDKQMGDMAVEHGMKMTEVGQSYSKALDSLLDKVKKAGDLNKTTAVMDEIKRFGDEKAMPKEAPAMLDLKNLQTAYAKQASIFEADKSQKIVTLTTKYEKALEGLQKKLVSSSKIDDAKAVQAERQRVKNVEAMLKTSPLLKGDGLDISKSQLSLDANEAKKIPSKLTQGLVLYYPFDTAGDRIADKSSSRNNGKTHGELKLKDGKRNGSLHFDGTSYIIAKDSNSLDIEKDITIAAWIKLDTLTTSGDKRQIQSIVSKYNGVTSTRGYQLVFKDTLFRTEDRLAFYISSSAKTFKGAVLMSDMTLIKDRWYHVVACCKANEYMKMYVDGVEHSGKLAWKKTEYPPSKISTNELDVRVGMDHETKGFFHGSMDEVMVWNRALAESEIKQLYESLGGE